MGPSQRIKELFDGYIRQELSPVEVEELVLLLGQADAEEALTEPMRRLWEQLRSRPAEYDVDWDRMYRQVSQADDRLADMRVSSGILERKVWLWRAAAAVFLGLAGLAAYWSVAYRRPVTVVAASPQAAVVNKDSAQKVTSWRTAENKKVVHLPDGSMVILNKHSLLKCGGKREVTLDGEAYFDIVHRPEQPFLVHTGRIVTRVLGTAFDIKAYSTDKSIEVTVDRGKVQVLNGVANLGMLSDRQQMRYEVGTESYRSQRVSVKPVIAWKPVEIGFDDITMEEAARRIGERFKVGFEFVNPGLKECRITATFYMEDDLDEIMTVICGVNQSTFRIRGDVVKIDGKGCN